MALDLVYYVRLNGRLGMVLVWVAMALALRVVAGTAALPSRVRSRACTATGPTLVPMKVNPPACPPPSRNSCPDGISSRESLPQPPR